MHGSYVVMGFVSVYALFFVLFGLIMKKWPFDWSESLCLMGISFMAGISSVVVCMVLLP
jgi:membrane-associated HD superfamily phosphohydrolase